MLQDSIWGRSIVLEGPGKSRACATIEPVDKSLLRTGEARFAAPVAGSIWFSSLSKVIHNPIYSCNEVHKSFDQFTKKFDQFINSFGQFPNS